ncbi:serine/threonine protein kinase [Blastomyces parvus]|uniref:Serine/threonine protein kinase n=1 Tax=Blastomyces parvus TaxID=2060905 RepID=A0A2B7WS54_9EURO|nr:serine/threonine protein kinase [Blastomyces parvus]
MTMSMSTNSTNTAGRTATASTAFNARIPNKEPTDPLRLGTRLVGQSGTQYQIDKMLQCRTEPVLACVYLASNTKDGKKYVLKNIFHTEFAYQLDMQMPLSGCSNVRVVMDTIPEHLLFVYSYFTRDLLELGDKRDIPYIAKKRILRDALIGLVDLHERRIVHTDIKPNNIFVDFGEKPGDAPAIQVNRVQIGDLEMGSMVPPDLNIRGARLGNPMWRSPEAHAAARVNLPADIFSFGLVCIYTILGRIIFHVNDNNKEGIPRSEDEKQKIIIKRLLSHFGDRDGLIGLVEHLHYDELACWSPKLIMDVAKGFTADDPRKPFSLWEDVDARFRDVVVQMMSLAPARRITARQALEHPWFRDV